MFKRFLDKVREKYRSLIFRILLYFTISAVAVALVLSWNFASRIKPRFENEVLPNLAQYIQYLVSDIGSPPDLIKARQLAKRLPFEMRIEGPDVSWSSSARLLPVARYHFHSAPYPYQQYQISRQKRSHLLLTQKQGYQYLFGVDSSFNSGSRDRHWILFTLIVAVLVLLYLGIRGLFRPLVDVSAHLKKIGAGELDKPITIKGASELTSLATGINQMTLDIKTMLESKAGLLLAISHELRSPITRMRVNLELLDENDTRQILIKDLQEIEELVTGILESERLNTRHALLNRSEFDLAELISHLIKQKFTDCNIEADLPPVRVNLDQVRIRLLVKNLLDNACRHSREAHPAVQVSLEVDQSQVILKVQDYGPGVSADELDHLTEPFYRSDSARLRKTGGYGLGLYLCQLIVDAHQGELSIQSAPEQGMCVTVRIPF